MYTNTVLLIFTGLIIIESLILYGLSLIERKRLRYKLSIILRKTIKTSLLITLSVFNVLFAFVHIKYVWHLLVIIGSNSVALIYFLFDFIYFSQRKRAYIVWMQKQIFTQLSFDEMFECLYDDGGDYNEEREDPFQKHSIVDTGDTNGKCIRYEGGNKKYLLKPKHKVDAKTLQLFAQRIELEKTGTETNFCNQSELPEFVYKEYDRCGDANSYSFITNKIFESFLFWILFIVLILTAEFLITYFAISYTNQFSSLEECLKSPINFPF